MDKYDEAVEHLKENPEEIIEAWENPSKAKGGCLFQFTTPSGLRGCRSIDGQLCGCLTQCVHGDRYAWTEDLTKRIRSDKRIPKDLSGINPENLYVFAEWQRILDKEIRS